ncbi:FAD-dependent pyridine nucleotide-disulfide oxidoreductase OS=Tsukamurella paurometabola (strain ATCC 8368 / DSM / CCUG 35730 / CIP 100753 / JCM 10117 /KCTC 9821 / NBRC 16120 / NCIMB 702349 / NCTC 13040) OX=521096 GN=Tpau_3081 PE=4 SV=1 [Tsukamurella paurometabola]|uniref:FAD-dependent pyridine nucleotide-disulfide oxidoreductase n=1 Tax=Tsukamurella paurometabola (strain ATCC 8368 / DSM 20162 / CCUG 35730 / CIP 100753 / JCM 10117 / KCTC 9821 / NBRC 16120 / NCIMB 702349 / NCTC 13040) TaxID=521096 RepID=D5UUV5_TSUPD|nr:FAD-dependent oxidoreductase [Tsukamurella paurometabola]ADG79673.1 FAD-dependent pyridine nucleotide-disulfide oxidoreductase [Tsukamurella paurometabola DSM 20162]SUP36705.1 Anthranilate 1,2-dioxygenase system ferredoxin--NAD(+) reductase component [Tsukamurella paurometabola]
MAAIIIVGGGLAAAKAAEALRDQGHDGPLTVIGAEHHRPYERPPLSKGYLQGTSDRDDVFTLDEQWYAEHDVALRTGVRVTEIERAEHTVTLANGESLRYDKLLLATGSRARELPGADGGHYLRTLDDSDRLREVFARGGHLGVVGAGWIGLEAAAAARGAGLEVTVVEPAAQPLVGALGPELGQVFADLHRAHGVDLRTATTVESVLPGGKGLVLGGGEEIATDAVLVGIGAEPNVDLAADAGLPITDGGVDVDAGLRTADPDIFAVGDIAAADNPLLGRRIRVEHWANALNQPRVAAANMLGGAEVYDRLPYFFTDQYELGMEYVGLSTGYDSVVIRGDLDATEFVAFWLADGRVIAGMNVNVWDVGDDVRALITSRRIVDSARLADPGVSLGEL